jgi:hypothetical protein
MAQLNGELVSLLRTILEDVCSHLPLSSTSARTLVASRSLECAHGCEQTYEDLSQAGLEALHALPRCGVTFAFLAVIAAWYTGLIVLTENRFLRLNESIREKLHSRTPRLHP